MRVYQDFFAYTDGIYKKSRYVPEHLYGYHSVRIIGWGDENGIKYWVSILNIDFFLFQSISFYLTLYQFDTESLKYEIIN